FPSGDPNYRLERYLIEIETLNKNLTKAREVWENIVKTHGKESETWIHIRSLHTYIFRYMGNHDEIHKKFKRASQQNSDWPERIFDAWEQFEHQYGTLDSLENALMFIRKQMKVVAHRRAKVQNVGTEQAFQVPTTFDNTQAEVSQSSRVSQPEISEQGNDAKKRKPEEDEPQLEGSPAYKKNKVVASNLPLDVTEGQLKTLFNECGKIVDIHIIEDSEKAQKSAHIEFAKRDDVLAALTKDKKKIGDNEINVYKITEHTLFITNFPETANLEEMFDKESALSALEMNGFEIETGKKLNVVISNPSLRKTRSPPKNLPSHVERSELETLCKTVKYLIKFLVFPHGSVIDVRIPTTKDKKCRGIAFVEFDSEEHAKAALALHNTEFKECILNVSLSNNNRGNGQKSTFGEPNNKETKAKKD
ncbi:8457_t:CDS:10, partial [Racocetra fulgida]